MSGWCSPVFTSARGALRHVSCAYGWSALQRTLACRTPRSKRIRRARIRHGPALRQRDRDSVQRGVLQRDGARESVRQRSEGAGGTLRGRRRRSLDDAALTLPPGGHHDDERVVKRRPISPCSGCCHHAYFAMTLVQQPGDGHREPGMWVTPTESPQRDDDKTGTRGNSSRRSAQADSAVGTVQSSGSRGEIPALAKMGRARSRTRLQVSVWPPAIPGAPRRLRSLCPSPAFLPSHSGAFRPLSLSSPRAAFASLCVVPSAH
ncbi:hypothetical protein PYCCODRAFT_1439641 [Trametes coccinea BRFM310]|uniref:Uncharacterized protein n=1 Tax=Trametes coccinea (strain BRFM310) TaxID=1353009 RepID=A0A1Y2IAH5_TRAC3|nr:hypothetical protein PYCCODRAFT_1439641 [Trametes coccinea BRFM310]